jgi:glycogen debranching enzyme
VSAGLDFDRAICSDEGAAERREWLACNGLGGFASGTLGGALTRRYHGLLVAALAPPLGRTLLGTRLDETVRAGGRDFALFENRWSDGTLEPRGARLIERFRLEAGMPVWSFALGGALLEKRIWMEAGANVTYVRYGAARALEPLAFEIKALVNYRDFHGNTHAGDWRMQVEPLPDGVRVVAFAGAVPFEVRAERGTVAPAHEWYRNYELARERERGLDDLDDNLHVATFGFNLAQDESVTISFRATPIPGSTLSPSVTPTGDPNRGDGDAALERARSRAAGVLRGWRLAQPTLADPPAWLEQLVLAADQFVVRRASPAGSTLIAGYHWFGDWGRDTMIALPGLTLATGRQDVAREILRTFAQLVDGGMLPNTLPGAGETAQYNTVDAALWFVEAVRLYVAATNDGALLAEVYPVLRAIARAYAGGTRFGIHEDPADGLIAAGEPGVQLTWMDAKVGDRVITPRIGKPVEIAALWLNAQATLRAFAERLGATDDATSFAAGFERTRAGFARFWNAERGFLYDVLDGPDGPEAMLRPNQLFALSLAECALSGEQQRAVVAVCARELLTTFGLRSLGPGEAGYCGSYAGDVAQRDGAYHQGTAWGWLIGPFALAHARAFGKPDVAASFVAAFGRQLDGYGIGTLPEIADGDAPHTPRGCIAQAWSVAEVLRVWTALA